MRYIVRVVVFPFLLIGYLFYFLYWRIWINLRYLVNKDRNWENQFLVITGIVILNLLYIAGPPLLVVALTGYWEYMVFIIGSAFAHIMPLVSFFEAWEYCPQCWFLQDIFNLVFFHKEKKKELCLPKTDLDEKIALQELNKEFPGALE